MPKKLGAKHDNSEGDLLHFGAVRLRVNGFGNLQFIFGSLDDVHTSQLANLALASVTNIEPLQLSNFTEQRASLTLTTTNINEWFFVSKIILFVKPVATSIPQ